MARKTLTISERAYNALDRARGKRGFPVKEVRRTIRKNAKESLLEYVRSTAPNNQLADRIEKVLKKRNSIHLRARVNAVRKREMIKAAESTDWLRESSKTPVLEWGSRDQKVAR